MLRKAPEPSFEVETFLNRLKGPRGAGHFLPCENGATEQGKAVALGFSCFALKIYHTLDLWCSLNESERTEWIQLIRSYQSNGVFVDPPVLSETPTVESTARAETKQAIATLAQVGVRPDEAYTGFPKEPDRLHRMLTELNWNQPWSAGGEAAALSVFVTEEAPQFLSEMKVAELKGVLAAFFECVTDRETGSYFEGATPHLDELVNGSMKVLTALDWLDVPIHYPKALIDTCLRALPKADGCHLVDVIYVLFRCTRETEYHKLEVKDYCRAVLTMIGAHKNRDGGFSYSVGKSQTTYYGVPIAKGLPESDIHGTCLLTWALAMIDQILEDDQLGWNVIKP